MYEPLKVLELYCGIGGMHYALKASKINAKVVAAIDINPNATLVYKHNFNDTTVLQKTIEGMKIEEFNKLDFDMILMSPPCQPFTRQGNQEGAEDARSQSFLRIISLIPELRKKPQFILMENVKGFDESSARDDFITMLKSLGYSFQEFLLSPIQFGIPNTRLRYFLIARLGQMNFEIKQETILDIIPDFSKTWIEELLQEFLGENSKPIQITNTSFEDTFSIKLPKSRINDDYKKCAQSDSLKMYVKEPKKLKEFLSGYLDSDNNLQLSNDLFKKWISSIDLVTKESTRTACFTKNYGRYVDGTGSLILKNSCETDEIELTRESLRFLHPLEIARLHCFPVSFEYPKDMKYIQCWKLIGNSLNVLIVTILIKLMTK